MAIIQKFIRRRPVLTYFVLTFAISGSGILLALGPGGLPITAETFETVPLLALMASLAGPSVAGILLTALVSGRAGLRELLSRLLKWRVGIGWYAVALLAAPLLATAVPLALSLFSREFLPAIFMTDDLAGPLLSAIIAGLLVGLFEELGWTGFATPVLRRRYSILTTGMIVGVLWGAWHFPMFWEAGSFSGALPLAILLARLFSWLPAYRVLMVWVYDHTESLLLAVLMHVSLTASMIIVAPVTLAEVPLLTSILVGAAAWWLLVAAVMLANRGQLSRPGKPPTGIGAPQLTPR
ncbi:MAG TPA: CPBP family intramembrane glutamic endopeptidase [Caldilineaceae bacterium]|nr:CPBP family intramembrane glutamic endopeptidase [Caldilineaceae bacterium]